MSRKASLDPPALPSAAGADGDAGEWDGLMYILLDWLDQEWQEMQEAREAA